MTDKNKCRIGKILCYFIKVLVVAGIFEGLFMLNYKLGLVNYPHLSGSEVLTIWASVLTVLFLVFSVLGLLQIDSRMKDLTDLKDKLTNLRADMMSELSSFKQSAKEEREKIVNQAEKEIARSVKLSVGRQNLYDRLSKIANILSPAERIDQYTNFLQASPNEEGINYAYIFICRGDAYRDLGQNEKAKNDYEHAIELSPDDEAPYISLGVYYSILHKYEESIKCFKKALGLQPKNTITCVNLANSFAKMKKFQEAQKYYDMAFDLGIDDPNAYYNKALFLKDSTQDTNYMYSEMLYKRCLSINPFFYMARINLATIYLERGNEESINAAREEYTKVLYPNVNNDLVNATIQRGNCNRLLNNKAAAIIDFSEVYRICPHDIQNLLYLAQAHYACTHWYEAYEFANMGLQEANKQNIHNCDEEFKSVLMRLNEIKKQIQEKQKTL